MKITAIKQQLKRADRFSVFVDGEYIFSLGEAALLDSRLVKGQEISETALVEFKQLAADDTLYDSAVRYVSQRLRSEWEMAGYLQRQDASPALIETILNRLSNIGLLDDGKFAAAFIADRQRFRPTSRRKIILELHAKHVSDEAIKLAMDDETGEQDEPGALRSIIERKRKQTRYQDDMKLMQYLVRQGFSYGDVKAALETISSEES